MANNMTRFGAVQMINGKPVEKFVLAEQNGDGEFEPVYSDSQLWRAGATHYTWTRNGRVTTGFAWDEATKDFVESDEIRDTGIKRAEQAAAARGTTAGMPINLVAPPSFDPQAFEKVRKFGDHILLLARTGKKEQLDQETILAALDRTMEFIDLLGIEKERVQNAFKLHYAKKQ